MKAILVCAVIVLAGCANLKVPSNVPQQALLECEYQAKAATANMQRILDRAYTEQELKVSCLRAKGYN